MKLAFPASAILKMFGTSYYFTILPVDAESKFDYRQEMRGSGAWMMTRYERGVGWTYEQNPNWYKRGERGGPFLDKLEYYLMPETSTRLAQLEAKNISFIANPGNDLVLTLKRSKPEMLMTASTPFRGNGGPTLIGMSKLPESRWEKDVRLRQALSMTIDRDAYIDTFNNVSGFRKEGLPFEVGWHTHIGCSWPGQWLNPHPSDNKMGENGKFFHHLPDEAAKLLRAAGMFGMEDTLTYAATGQFGTPKQIEVLVQMMNEGGHFKIKLNPDDYTTVITPKYTFGHGTYPDMGTHPFGSYSDLDVCIWNIYSPSGRNDIVNHHTPELQDLMIKHRRELDVKKRTAIAHDWQKAIAKHMPVVPFPGSGTLFNLHWPWLENYGWLDPAPGGVTAQEIYPYYWYNKAKDSRTA
jgi:ABC-type transport system substrate-binding protein